MARPEFGRAAEDYGRFRQGFPPSLMDRLARFGIGLAGQRVVDLGTGTGTLARLFAGRRCSVIGVDPDRALLAQARRLDAASSVHVHYVAGVAEAVPLLGSRFDAVSAGQCWHWFDRPAAAAEARRLLAPGGRIVIAHFDWLPLAGNVVAETERLIQRHNPSWRLGGGTGIHPAWLTDLAEAGFRDIETFSYDVAAVYSHDAWLGRIRASAGLVTLDPEARERSSCDLADLLATRFPDDPLDVPHRVWAVVSRK